MKFKLRGMDADAQGQQNPVYHSQSSSSSSPYTYFSQQAFRVGFPTRSFSGGHGGPEMFRGRFDMRDSIQRELEKERIREEIIAEELARKRTLEEEVRQELMMERQMMAMRNGGGFPSPYMPLPLQPSHHNLLEQEILHRQPIGLEERIIMSIDEKNARGGGGGGGGDSHPHGIRGFDGVPFQRFSDSPIIKGIPTPLQKCSQKQIITQDKPKLETLTGAKRKPPPQVTGDSSDSSYSDTNSNKRIQEEWSCAICQVTATSERGLKEHIQGKKHQLKEAALIARKSGVNYGLGVAHMKPMVKLAVTTVNLSSGERNPKPRKLECNQTPSANETSSSTNVSNDSKKEGEMHAEEYKDKFKFWCEMCKVGAFSEKVMNNHKEGKKHSANLVKLLEKGKPEIPFFNDSNGSETMEETEVACEPEVKFDMGEESDTSVSI